MILRSVRRGGGTAIAAACVAAVSCSVYDSSLLSTGPSEVGGSGATAGVGNAGTTGESGGGTGGKPTVTAGSSGAPETGGMTADAGAAGAGDEGGDTGSAGRASAGGGGKSGGSGGTAGEATGGASGGASLGGAAGAPVAGGAGASAGAGGAPVAMGCGKLSVPLDDNADRAHFVITLPTNANMSTTGTVAMRLYVAAGTGGTVFNYVQDQNNRFMGNATNTPIASGVGKWTTLTWDVAAQPDSTTTPSNIDKTIIHRIGIEVQATSTGPWTAPTLIYVDSIIVTAQTVTYNYTLDTTATVYTPATGTSSDQTNVFWFNNNTSDTKAANVMLTWQATCP